MTDFLDLWVETSEGLVRADQIVHVRTRGSELQVMLPLIETTAFPGMTESEIVQVTHTVSRDVVDSVAMRDFVGFISWHRATGHRGVIAYDKRAGRFTFSAFDDPVEG